MCVRVSIRRFRETQTTTFMATNIYARYKVCTVASILKCMYSHGRVVTIVAIFLAENYVARG